jgi:hypothetical protein
MRLDHPGLETKKAEQANGADACQRRSLAALDPTKAWRLAVNSALGDVYQMYIKDRRGEGSVCQHCRRESSRKGLEHIGPVPIFHVGENFAGSPHRLLILGSVAYGWETPC